MIFKAKFNWRTKKEVCDQLFHIIKLIEDNYPSGFGWSLSGEEVAPLDEPYDDKEGKFKDDLLEQE